MSKSAAALIAAMHTTAGSKPRQANAWLELAQTDEVLRAAVRAVFGKRLPTPAKLGQWLSEHIGTKAGALTLLGAYSTRRKAWRYRVADLATEQLEQAAQEAELRATLEAQQAAARESAERRERERAEAKAVRDAERASAPSTLTITQAPTPVEYETTTRVASDDGRVIHERAIGRDGQPIRKHPQPAATPEKPAEPTHAVTESHHAPWIGINPSGTPVLKRQPSRAELAERHKQSQLPDGHCENTGWRNSITPDRGRFNL